MSSSAFHGTPCLVPVQIRADAQDERRGFITRLSTLAAAVSSDPALVLGQTVTLAFKRPSDAEPIETSGTVASLLPEGGLWRGRPAALVEFEAPVELDEAGAQAERHQPSAGPLRLENEAGQTAGLGSALRQRGLGRRKRTGRLRRPAPPQNPYEAVKPPPPVGEPISGTPPAIESAAELEASFFDDEATAPPTQGFDGDDDTMPPPDEFGPPSVGFSDLFPLDDATVPPKLPPTDPALSTETGRIHMEFMNQFGQPAEHALPPGAYEDPTDGFPGDVPGELPDEAIGRVSSNSVAVAETWGYQREETTPAPSRPWADAPSHDAPPVQDSGAIPAPTDLHATGERPPWEEDLDDIGAESFLPRNARITSTINVHFWARGRRNRAIADNFSREGLFLTYADKPPVRGAIVRVEFPLEGEHESLPVRFNAEVRWHRADRPGAGLPDGFGVQILTFETPKDRARYEELLDAILALGPAWEPAEHGFSWGTGGNAPS